MTEFEFINEYIKGFDTKFKVDKERGIVTCIMTTTEDFLSRIIRYGFAEAFYRLPLSLDNLKEEDLDVRKYVGVAKCNPADEWDEEYGKQLAEYRAALKRRNDINQEIENFCYRMNCHIDNLWFHGKLRQPKHPDER